MLQQRKILLVAVLTTILSLAIILFALIYSNKISLSFLNNPPVQEIKPEPVNIKKTIGRLPNILYPQNPDASGRDVYYLTSDLDQNIRYAGVGIIYYPAKTEIKTTTGSTALKVAKDNQVTNYVVGSFDYWEQIPGSKDYYLYLKDVTGIKDKDGKEIAFPKYRVGFETENLKYNKDIYMTAFGVEDLDSVVPKVKDPQTGVKAYNLGLIGNHQKEDLEKLIKPGDTIALTISIDPEKNTDLLDNNKAPVISWLFIRRFNPIENINQVLKKEVLFK